MFGLEERDRVRQEEAPETALVQRAVEASREKESVAWAQLAGCSFVEVYTDGSAPVRNPGGQAGFSAVLLGWNSLPEVAGRPAEPDATLEVAGFIPARQTEPPTSNNRAEMTGIIAALAVARALPQQLQRLVVWSDSDYAVHCATGRYTRRKNLDLWAAFDALAQDLRGTLSDGLEVRWLKGHAGLAWNERADHLATRAAFDFDEAHVQRYRAAQRATGREMPYRSSADPRQAGADSRQAGAAPHSDGSAHEKWQTGADYTVVIYTHIHGTLTAGCGPALGRYQLWTRHGAGAPGEIQHDGERTADEGDYLTIIAALEQLLERITARGGDSARFTVALYSRREGVIKQLRGEYRVRADRLQSLHTRARALLDRFAGAELIWKQGPAIEQLLAP